MFSKLGVGVINTQHHAHLTLGTRVLDEMEEGGAPHEALERVLSSDEDADERQFIAIDVKGRRGAWTGRKCAESHSHQFGDHCVAAGNYLASRQVVARMIEAFEAAGQEQFEDRLFAALRAGARTGGDRRGQRAAAVIVVPGRGVDVDINLDLRVDHHDRPLDELERLHRQFRREFPVPAYVSDKAIQ